MQRRGLKSLSSNPAEEGILVKEPERSGWKTIRISESGEEILYEKITPEFPVTIILDGQEFATIVCSPSELENLTIGFLASEGVIRTYNEIKSLQIDGYKGYVYIHLKKPVIAERLDHSSRFIGSCCGKSRQFYFKSDARTAKTITNKFTVSTAACFKLMKELMEGSEEFNQTGGVHNAALATAENLLITSTDIGRHNTLDKIFGTMLRDKISARDKLIVFSGRISSEVLLKVSKMGIGFIISKAALTDLAVELANDLGITVIGFARDDRMNIYSHPERISNLSIENKLG